MPRKTVQTIRIAIILDPDERFKQTNSTSNRKRRVAYYKFGKWNKTRDGLVEVPYSLSSDLPSESTIPFLSIWSLIYKLFQFFLARKKSWYKTFRSNAHC